MIIDKITIQDVGVYAGKQEIILAPTSAQKPVILIGGLNGGGKTTLLDALQLCMYGKNSKLSNRGKKSYDQLLRDSIHRGTNATSAAINVGFRQYRNGEEHSYEVCRSWEVSGNKCKERFSVCKDGKLDELATDNWDEHVDRFLPRQIAPLFFFDGEKVEEYADPLKAPELIETAIHGLLGLDTVDQLLSDLSILEKRKLAHNLDTADQERAKNLEDEVSQKQKELDLLKQVTANLKSTSLVEIDKQLISAKEEFQKKGGGLYERRREIESAHVNALQQKDRCEASLRRLASGALPLLLNSHLLNKLKTEARHAQSVERAKTSSALIEAHNQKLIEFVKGIDGGKNFADKTIAYLENEEEELKLEACKPIKFSPQSGTLPSLLALEENLSSQIIEDVTSLCGELESAQETIARLETEIEGIPTKDSIAALSEKVTDLSNKRMSLLHEIDRNQNEIEQRKNDLTRCHLALKSTYEKDAYITQGKEDNVRVVEFSSKSRSTLEKFREGVINRHLSQIQRLVLESFKQLSRKETLVANLEIDVNSFSISLFDVDENNFGPEQLSAGERQLLSVAILWGLSKASGRPLPTVIDTPLGRLDGIHRSKLIDTYFPNAGHQVILLSTDEEIGYAEKTKLKPFIGREYTLSFNDHTCSTTVIPGYAFGEEVKNVS
ncbi:MAG: DNA sulfur modification protein DndD [Kordiimonas sp.]